MWIGVSRASTNIQDGALEFSILYVYESPGYASDVFVPVKEITILNKQP